MANKPTIDLMDDLPDKRLVIHMARQVLANTVFTTRQEIEQYAGYAYGGDRDYYKVLGYRRQVRFEDYLGRYLRQDIAQRIVDLPAEDTWRDPPKILDGKGDETRDDTEFVTAVGELFDRLGAWEQLENVDALCGLGHYAVLLIGTTASEFDQSLDMKEPLIRVKGTADVIYLRAYDEGNVTIRTVDADKSSPRFGLPTSYLINIGEDIQGISSRTLSRGRKRAMTQIEVHWTRVIHVAEKRRFSQIFGIPRLQGILNRLDDLEKVVGGGAEATWKLVYKGIVLSLKEGFKAPANDDSKNELEARVEDYVNDIRRVLIANGYDVTEMGGQVVDPTGMVEIILMLISAKTGIPKRLLTGSELGELASSQDASNWAGRIKSRRTKHAEPVILRPFLNHLIKLGALPAPDMGVYTIEWVPAFELNDLQKADIALKTADALSKLTGGVPSDAVEESEIREIVGLPAQRPNQDVLFDIQPEGEEEEDIFSLDPSDILNTEFAPGGWHDRNNPLQLNIDQDKLEEVFQKYHAAVNMGADELAAWSKTDCSKRASLDRSPITRNLRLLKKKKGEWTAADVRDANKTIAFVARMKENLGGKNVVKDKNGRECGTKAYISLKNWAYDSRK